MPQIAPKSRVEPPAAPQIVVQVRAVSSKRPKTGWNAKLASKLSRIARDLSLREIGARTETNSETVRRYLRDGNPCARFLAKFCEVFGISSDAVLGISHRTRGPRSRVRIVTSAALRTSPPKASRGRRTPRLTIPPPREGPTVAGGSDEHDAAPANPSPSTIAEQPRSAINVAVQA